MAAPHSPTTRASAQDPTLGALVHDMTQQMSTLVRDEMRLAQAEMTQKGKKAGLGIGLFGGAGLVALYGVATLLATVILALALVIPAWLAALIVTVVLFAVAGVLALHGQEERLPGDARPSPRGDRRPQGRHRDREGRALT